MAGLMSYRRLLSDFSKHVDQPIKNSYLADLHAFLYGASPKTNGRVAEQIVFSLVRELFSFRNQFNNLITFLKTALDCEPRLLQVLDGFTNGYWRLRIKSQPHMTAIKELSRFNVLELSREIDNSDWINVRLST